MRVPIPFGMATDQAPSLAVSAERLLNGYVEAVPKGKTPAQVYGTPGLVTYATAGSGPIRAMLEEAGVVYALSGGSLYRIAEGGAATLLGSGVPDGLASMETDGTNVVIEAGGEIWIWNGTTFAEASDADRPIPAAGVAWINSHFVFYELGTDILQSSGIAAPADFNALNFAASETRPDYGVAPIVMGRTLYAFGSRTVEAFYYDAGEGFPFSPYKDVDIDVGLIGKRAAKSTKQTIYWLGHDLVVYRLDGSTAKRISTHAIERIIDGWSEPELTVTTSHVWRGHLFVTLRNPEGCVEYDQATELWHERGSYGSDTWRCAEHCDAFGETLFGDAETGVIYRLDPEAYDEAGDILPFEATGPFVFADGMRFVATDVELIMETGEVSISLPDPQAMFCRSEDGRTWSGPKQRSVGATGEYRKRVRFGRQGQSRGFVPSFRITDAIPRVLIAAYAEIEPET